MLWEVLYTLECEQYQASAVAYISADNPPVGKIAKVWELINYPSPHTVTELSIRDVTGLDLDTNTRILELTKREVQ